MGQNQPADVTGGEVCRLRLYLVFFGVAYSFSLEM